jgi:hypothetical protein
MAALRTQESPKSVIRSSRYRSIDNRIDPTKYLNSLEVADYMVDTIVKKSNSKINEKAALVNLGGFVAGTAEATMGNYL